MSRRVRLGFRARGITVDRLLAQVAIRAGLASADWLDMPLAAFVAALHRKRTN